MTSKTLSPRKTRVDVDWSFLLALNPPLGYSPRASQNLRESYCSYGDEDDNQNENCRQADDSGSNVAETDETTDDKVVLILRSILQGLEREIEQGKQSLKGERKRRQRDRRLRREARLAATMTSCTEQPNKRHTFTLALASPLGKAYNAFTSCASQHKLEFSKPSRNNFKPYNGGKGLRKHESFSVSDKTKSPGLSDVVVSGVRTQGLERRAPRRTSSYAGSLDRSGWSRHAREPNDITDDVTNHNNSTDEDSRNAVTVNTVHVDEESNVGNASKSESHDINGEVANSNKESVNFDTDIENYTDVNKSDVELIDTNKAQSNQGTDVSYTLPRTYNQKKTSKSKKGDDSRNKTRQGNTREHMKNRIRSFELLPNKKILLDTMSQSSIDYSDDTLSDASSIHTIELDMSSPRSSGREQEMKFDSPRSYSIGRASRYESDVRTKRFTSKFTEAGLEQRLKCSSVPSLILRSDSIESETADSTAPVRTPDCTEDVSVSDQKANDVSANAEGNADTLSYKRDRLTRQSSEPVLKVMAITEGDSLRDPLMDESAGGEASSKTFVSRDPDPVRNSASSSVGPSTRYLDRPWSAGTSGYSTDEYSGKTTDSEDDVRTGAGTADQRLQKRKLDKYFLVLKRRSSMAVRVDNSNVQNGNHASESCPSFLSMADLAIPDHMGALSDQSNNQKIWGVVLDMLFCVFDDQLSEKPRDVIILPGCNIRPLVYKSAINGVKTHSQTVSGISKFQFVIDDSSSCRKHVFGVDSQLDLDTWYKVLKKAAALDPEITNDITTSLGQEPLTLSPRRLSFDDELLLSKAGYTPSQDMPNRQEKLNSPRRSERQTEVNGNGESACNSPSRIGTGNGCQPSPRGTPNLIRRQSIQDFKKRLRRETPEAEASKHHPIKAKHFEPPKPSEEPLESSMGKKNKSFGSFENLLKFKRKKKRTLSEDSASNDSESIVSSSSIEQDFSGVSRSIDISASESKLGKKKSKNMSRSLEFTQPKNGVNAGIVRRASDIKDKMFNRRAGKPFAKLGDLHDYSVSGFLDHKHHLKWTKLWCVVSRGCFYGFRSQSPEEGAQVAVLLANCAVVYVSEKDKRQKHLYVFKLSQEKAKSIYLCTSDYRELMKWLTVLQMESNSVISNGDKIRAPSLSESDSVCSSLSSQSGSLVTSSSAASANGNNMPEVENSRSRSKKKRKAPPKPPRHSSCPPPASRDSGTTTGEDTLTSGSVTSSATDHTVYSSTEDLPRYDRALTHVWQNDRGYLFNAIRAKLSAYRKRNSADPIFNKDANGNGGDGLLLVQDGGGVQTGREVRRSRSFNANGVPMATDGDVTSPVTSTPSDSPTSCLRKRHKPLVVKRVSASELAATQTIAGYLERRSASAQWIKYWNVLHEGTLFCFLTSNDDVTVDVLNLRGYFVDCMVDKFRGKRFVLHLSHENFTSLYLSMETREDMEQWHETLIRALEQPSSNVQENGVPVNGACADCASAREEENVDVRRQHIKQKLLEEMLRQKHELERKQATRLKKQHRSNGLDSPDRGTAPDVISDDQRTSNVTQLRQRRMSTQLKVETIQKQIEKPSTSKRGIFGFGKTKKLDENRNVFLQDQLKELNHKLHKIDNDLTNAENEIHSVESFDLNQNRKPAMTSHLMSSERANDSEDEEGRSKNLKSAVQKWTNKTFSKNSVKKKAANQQNGKVTNMNGNSTEMLNHRQDNGVMNMNGGFDDDQFDSIDSIRDPSLTDLTKPMADLKLDLSLPLNLSAYQMPRNGSESPGSIRYNRSNSRTSTLSSLSSPRREVDPSVMAEIDAFEELTKQVLGARSKDVPAK